jgi:phospho-N-acetylmuramoyl-pentapeptide-transferase
VQRYIYNLNIANFLPFFIKKMRQLKKEQPIRLDGPQTHLKKRGTPTMGGVVILFSIAIGTLLFAPLTNYFIWILLIVMTLMGLLGFYDDYQKLKNSSSNGISGRKRLFIEFFVAAIAVFATMNLTPNEFATAIKIPYFAHLFIPLGIFYVAFASFVFAGTTNAVNLTDGLDGLVTVPLIISFICFGIFAFLGGDSALSSEYELLYIPNLSALSIFATSVIGALFAFLYYNHKPAKILMGDVGALGLGGSLGMLAIIAHQEILLAIIGFLFVIEALSDMLQVGYYKRTGKRIFLMAPIHHHFEKMGWSERKVVFSFWMFSAVMGMIGLAALL